MESDLTNAVPLDVQQRIDACCQAFEEAWKSGEPPKIEDFVAKVPPSHRGQLLRELVILELNYRRDDGCAPLSDLQICELHPELMPELKQVLHRLRGERSSGLRGDAVTQSLPVSVREVAIAVDPDAPSKGSRGLHIRCPHCSNPVELLSDTPLESITCRTCGSAFSLIDKEERTREAPSLKRIGRFELVARLGIGGFGTVWKARDTELDRTVAVKIPRKGQLAREEVEQFFREARSAAQLRHPNIVPVHEVGRDGETIFIVSDLVRGVSLSDWLSGATPNVREIAQIMATVADALHHAHEKGVIHRDLKPSNILLDDSGQPHVMDFGLAKREVGEVTMTVDGHVLGTPAYMSPEQAEGQGHWTDRRSDIYSLGAVLFRMLTGELPFRGNAQMQIHQRLNQDPPDPRTLNRHLPRDLCTICLKCLERDPNRRYATAKGLAEELRRFIRHEPIQSRPVSRTERALRWAKRNPALATAAALTAFLAIAGPLAALLIERQRSRLQDLLAENVNLIDRYKAETRRADSKISELSRELDLWEGRANPWDFWPPQPGAPPRRNMAADILNHATATLAQRLRSGTYGGEAAARGYLGMAALADAAGQSSEARAYYELARDELLALWQQHPDRSEFARALADCYTQLARLAADRDRDQAAGDLQRARAIYRQLATERAADAVSQIDWLESELSSATLAGFDAAQGHLSRVGEINRTLRRKWPSDPDAIYHLACYLCEREPILLARPPRATDDAPATNVTAPGD